MTTPLTARPCRCDHPLRDEDGCLRCGRSLPVAPDPGPEPTWSSTPRGTWTRAGVVRVIQTFKFFRGRPPIPADWKYIDARHGWPSLAIVESLFGSFPAAVRAAGLRTAADAREENWMGQEGPTGRAAA